MFLGLVVSLLQLATVAHGRSGAHFRLQVNPVEPVRPAIGHVVTKNVIHLERKPGEHISRRYVRIAHDLLASPGDSRRALLSVDSIAGSVYVANIQFGHDTPFKAVIDTGSSDTWVARRGFQCVSPQQRTPIDEESCSFGSLYDVSPTFEPIPNRYFNISYVDGEFLNGSFGWENVTLAGISFNQTVAVVDEASWFGDGISSGLIGFAYPALTSAFEGVDSTDLSPDADVTYSPLFTTMYKEYNVPSVFSLALTRDGGSGSSNGTSNKVGGGSLALGGIPHGLKYQAPLTQAKIQMLALHSADLTAGPEYQFYSINIDGYAYNGSTIGNMPGRTNKMPPPVVKPAPDPADSDAFNKQVIIDSGTTLIYTPSKVAADVAALFSPPAELDSMSGSYKVSCTATVPKFGIIISGRTFPINPLDMILPSPGRDRCTVGVQPMDGMNVLGDVFLRNVLAVFDVGGGRMLFGARSD